MDGVKVVDVAMKYGYDSPDSFTKAFSRFKYLIADDYVPTKELPEGFEKVVIPENTWAVFPCKGPMPKAMQKVYNDIFSEWIPGNTDYEITGMYNIEFYSAHCNYPKGNQDENYYSEIWMPVKVKEV